MRSTIFLWGLHPTYGLSLNQCPACTLINILWIFEIAIYAYMNISYNVEIINDKRVKTKNLVTWIYDCVILFGIACWNLFAISLAILHYVRSLCQGLFESVRSWLGLSIFETDLPISKVVAHTLARTQTLLFLILLRAILLVHANSWLSGLV